MWTQVEIGLISRRSLLLTLPAVLAAGRVRVPQHRRDVFQPTARLH